MKNKIRLSDANILIVDDHSLFREGLHRILKDSEIKNIYEASNGEEAIATAETIKPEIILMDYHMPDMNGVETAKIILENNPEIIVVILTVNEDDGAIAEALSVGAQGYLNKNMRSMEIVNSLRNLLKGKVSLAKPLNENIIDKIRKENLRKMDIPEEERRYSVDITYREKEVLLLLAKGLSNKELGDKLSISENTVKNHVSKILDKLEVKSRSQAVAKGLSVGVISKKDLI